MARKPNTSTVIDHGELDEKVKSELQAGHSQASEHSEQILATYGDGEDFFDLHLFERKTLESAQRAVIGFLDAGRYLTVIKEHVPHGDWLDSLNRMNIAPRAAQRMMQAAVKFLDRPGNRKVLESINSKANLLELLVLDSDEIEELGEGGTVRGIELDELDRMTSTELRKALREAREEREAKDRVIEKKQAMITDLQTKSELVKSKPVDEVAEMLRSQANTCAFSAEAAIRGELAGALEALFEFQAENNLDQTPFAEGLVRQVQLALDDVCSTYGIAVDGGSAVPAWQRDDADEVVAQAIANEQAD